VQISLKCLTTYKKIAHSDTTKTN